MVKGISPYVNPLEYLDNTYWVNEFYTHHRPDRDYFGGFNLKGKTYEPGGHTFLVDHPNRMQGNSRLMTMKPDSYLGNIEAYLAKEDSFFDGSVDPLAEAYAQADRAMNEGIKAFESLVNMPFKNLSGLYGVPPHSKITYRGSRVGYNDNG